MHLRNRQVTSLRTGGDRVYISAGLNEGDLVSLTSLDASFAGAKVEILSSTPTNLLFDPTQQAPAQQAERTEEITAATGADGVAAGGQ